MHHVCVHVHVHAVGDEAREDRPQRHTNNHPDNANDATEDRLWALIAVANGGDSDEAPPDPVVDAVHVVGRELGGVTAALECPDQVSDHGHPYEEEGEVVDKERFCKGTKEGVEKGGWFGRFGEDHQAVLSARHGRG